MNSRRVYYILVTAILMLILSVLGIVYVGNSSLNQSSLRLTELKLEKSVIEEQKKALNKATKDLVNYTELETIANKIVPKDKDQAKTVREINSIAQENGVTLSDISFPTSNLGTEQKKQSNSEDSSSKKETAPPVSQVEAAEGLKGVYKLEVTVQSDDSSPISFNNLVKFLTSLENNRRTAQVSSINIIPDEDNPNNLTFTLTINVFIKP